MNGDEFESVASVFCRNIETPSCLWVWIWIHSTTTATEKERSIVVGAEGSRESRSFLQLKAELCCLLYILFQKTSPLFKTLLPLTALKKKQSHGLQIQSPVSLYIKQPQTFLGLTFQSPKWTLNQILMACQFLGQSRTFDDVPRVSMMAIFVAIRTMLLSCFILSWSASVWSFFISNSLIVGKID